MDLCTCCQNGLVDELLCILTGNAKLEDFDKFVEEIEDDAKRGETTPELVLIGLAREAQEVFFDGLADLFDTLQMRRES